MAKSNTAKKRKAVAGKKGVSAGSIVEDEFGNYKIRAGQLNGVFVARAFPRDSARSQGIMAESEGSSEEDAIAALKSLLAEREAERSGARRWEARSESSVPTQEEFLEALRQTILSDAQKSILKAHAIAGDDGLVAASIMSAGGFKTQNAAIKALAKAGLLVAGFTGLGLPAGNDDGLDPAIRVLGYRKPLDSDAPLHLILHKELRDAVWQTL